MVPTKPNGVHDAPLRLNQLKRRASALGTTVSLIVHLDAEQQRTPLTKDVGTEQHFTVPESDGVP